ncbi:hypothetical protein K2Q16_00155 [Patescibacteria group bacterium]|nr:hypothetical protein [Patescibacteria group bacterium]
MREAFRTVALEQSVGQLDVEEVYSLVRIGLVHMLSSNTPVMGMTEVKGLLEELMPKAREYLAEVSAISSREYLRKLSDATAALSQASARAYETCQLKKKNVETFLRVLDHYRALCFREGYNPTDIIGVDTLLLGQLVAEEFERYGDSLNSTA